MVGQIHFILARFKGAEGLSKQGLWKDRAAGILQEISKYYNELAHHNQECLESIIICQLD